MIKRLFFIAFFIFSFNVLPLLAHAPSQIELTYDEKEANLHIHIVHPSTDIKDHYIYKVVVLKNDEIIKEIFFKKQYHLSEINKDVSMKTKDGDVISVEAFSRRGGSLKEVLKFGKKEEVEEKEEVQEKVDVSSEQINPAQEVKQLNTP